MADVDKASVSATVATGTQEPTEQIGAFWRERLTGLNRRPSCFIYLLRDTSVVSTIW